MPMSMKALMERQNEVYDKKDRIGMELNLNKTMSIFGGREDGPGINTHGFMAASGKVCT